MFEYEKYEQLLNNPEEAKKYCLSLQNDFIAQAELIMLDIIFFHEKPFPVNYQKLEEYLKLFKRTGNKRGYVRVVSNLTFYSIDLRYYTATKKYAEITIKYLPDYIEAKIALAFANIKLNKDIDSSFEFLKSQCNNDDLSTEVKNLCYTGISDYFCIKHMFIEGYNFFEKSLIYCHNKALPRREMLNMTIEQNADLDRINEAYEMYKEYADDEEKKSIIFYISDRLFNLRLCKEALDYVEKAYEFDLNKNELDNIHIFKARCKGINKDYQGVMEEINQISEHEVDNNPYIAYLIATTIFLKDDRREFNKGIESLKRAYSIAPSDENLANLINGYLMNEQYTEAEQIMNTHKFDKRNPIYLYYQGIIFMKKGAWKKAEQRLFNYMIKVRTRIPEYAYVAVRNTPIKKAIFKDYENGNTLNDIRHQANMNLHGFGMATTPNVSLAISLLEKKQEDLEFNNCAISILGNAYLKNNEEEKAFTLFKKGHERYINYKDNCTCSTGFYCYCLANGIGVTRNEDEAFRILDELSLTSMSNICVFTYVEYCIKYNKKLEKAWTLLENLHEWRYNAGKYFMMAKLASLLNKKPAKYLKQLKKCLKHVPIEEKLHYLDDPETFYLTNI